MSKFTIYQVLPRHFGNNNTNRIPNGSKDENGCGKFNSFTTKALSEIKKLGITHIWYTGIIEHATQTDYTAYGIDKDHAEIVKGKAGSPYAIKDYYDVDPDLAEDVYARMTEFEDLVIRTQEAKLKVIIDFVPNHVSREYKSDAKPLGVKDLGEEDHSGWHFSPLNNFYYIPNQQFSPEFELKEYTEYPAKASGNDVFNSSPSINDWYETIKLNYGVNYAEGGQKQFDPIPNTWNKMLDILNFWASKGIDGFRCDMAEMVPVEFWGWVIPLVKSKYPEIIFIAEVYNKYEYKNYLNTGKFDYLYDKVGLYDKLRDITSKNFPVRELTQTWQSLDGIEDNMLNFLENHDEQRIASGFFAGNGISAQPAMIIAATLTQAPVMIYSGQELGELGMDFEGFSGVDGRTSIFDYWSVKSIQAWSNEGKYNVSKLSSNQKELREFYKKLLNISISEKAISHGKMFDLVYANLDNPKFNTHEQFAYFRKYENELLLIVLNFHDIHLETEIIFPEEAFSYLSLKSGEKYKAINLLDTSEQITDIILSTKDNFCLHLDAWKGKIFKLSLH